MLQEWKLGQAVLHVKTGFLCRGVGITKNNYRNTCETQTKSEACTIDGDQYSHIQLPNFFFETPPNTHYLKVAGINNVKDERNM